MSRLARQYWPLLLLTILVLAAIPFFKHGGNILGFAGGAVAEDESVTAEEDLILQLFFDN